MKDEERGQIRNREFATQIRDFRGLRFGRITPTDIDAFLEFDDRAFIFIESKHGESLPKMGQRLALERLSDAVEDSGRKSVVFIARHTTSGDIDFATLPVAFVRLNRTWRKPHRELTIREAIEDFLAWCAKKSG